MCFLTRPTQHHAEQEEHEEVHQGRGWEGASEEVHPSSRCLHVELHEPLQTALIVCAGGVYLHDIEHKTCQFTQHFIALHILSSLMAMFLVSKYVTRIE